MPAVVIVGLQWGDEGKGKIIDYLAQHADAIIRYQGGPNAGHTIVVGGETYKFHLIPSGVLHRDKYCILGNGMVIDAEQLLNEIKNLHTKGISTDKLKISHRAHLILPTHVLLDQQSEKKLGKDKIGTTGKGVGPAYYSKVKRCGVRVGDGNDLHDLLVKHLDSIPLDRDASSWTEHSLAEITRRHLAELSPYICDTSDLANDILDKGGRVLLEGAQGTLLDIDHGTYPFVTASSPTAGGACIGSGIGPTRIHTVIGVVKAYTTRVGAGPFPTELPMDSGPGEIIFRRGKEIGTTTGRHRKCGWLDLVALRYAVRINGISHLAMTKLDVLDTFDEIKVCVAYEVDGKRLTSFPATNAELSAVRPIYESLSGWNADISTCDSWTTLPPRVLSYLQRVEDYVHVPVSLISYGADRHASLDRHSGFSKTDIWR